MGAPFTRGLIAIGGIQMVAQFVAQHLASVQRLTQKQSLHFIASEIFQETRKFEERSQAEFEAYLCD